MGLFDALRGVFGSGDEEANGSGSDGSVRRNAGESTGRDNVTGGADGRGAADETADADESADDPADADPGPERFRGHAEELADRDDVDLDFTLDSLAALDEYAADQREVLGVLGEEMDEGGDELLERMHGGYTVEWGSYFGEVLVREFDGQWVGGEGEGWAVAVPLAGEVFEVAVFDVAAGVAAGDMAFADAVDDIEDAMEDGPGVADDGDAGAGGGVGVADPAGEETGPEQFRAESEELVESWGEYDLDYSPESLGRLEDLIEAHYGDGHFDDAEFGGEDDVRSLSLTGFTIQFGSYLGEVLRREFGGQWVETDEGWTFEVADDPADVEVGVFAIAHRSLVEAPELVEAFEGVAAARESVLGYGVAPDAETAAAELVAAWPDATLDYSPESLAGLDDLVDEEWEKARFRDATLGGDSDLDERYTELVVRLGSYYGETLRRSLDSEWTHAEEFGVAVAVSAGDEQLIANVFHIAEDCLTEPSKFAFQFDVIAEQVGADVPQVSDGDGEVFAVDPDEVEEEAEEADPEDVISGFQDDAADFAEAWPDYDLDFSPASLIRADELVRVEFEEYDFEDVELGDETDGDSLFLTAHAMDAGAYFAAVLQRHLGAEWRTEDATLIVPGRDAHAEVDPIGIAANCFRSEDSFAATYEALRGELSIDAPPVEE